MPLRVSNSTKVSFSEGYLASVPMKLVIFSPHLPSVLLVLRQSRFAASNGMGTGMGTTISHVRKCS
jgi:hypothetical protein